MPTPYPEAIAMKNIDTETVADALVDMFSGLGIPEEILTDQGTQFTSDMMKEVSRILSIKQLTCTPYHAMANGLVEKMNGVIKQMIKRMCSERPKYWDRCLKPALFAYRECPHTNLAGFFPFEELVKVLTGRHVRGPLAILRELWTKEKMDTEVKTTYQYVLELVNTSLEKASSKYKTYYDKGKKPRNLKVGDKVLLLLPTEHNKLLLKWKGPYSVVRGFNDNDYQVQIDDKVKSFHINMLKRYVEREPVQAGGSFDKIEPNVDTVVPEKIEVVPDTEMCSLLKPIPEEELEWSGVQHVPNPSSLQKDDI